MAREDLVFNRMSRVFKRLGSHLGTVFTIEIEISTGVLGFVAQTFSLFLQYIQVSIYIQGKFGEMKTYLSV